MNQEPGICPVCGKDDIQWHGSDICDNSIRYDAECLDCGAYFEEWYNLVFTEQILVKG